MGPHKGTIAISCATSSIYIHCIMIYVDSLPYNVPNNAYHDSPDMHLVVAGVFDYLVT